MKNKIIINVKSLSDILDYKKVGVTTFLFALKGFCVGYENEFSIEEINSVDECNLVITNLKESISFDEPYDTKYFIDNIHTVLNVKTPSNGTRIIGI